MAFCTEVESSFLLKAAYVIDQPLTAVAQLDLVVVIQPLQAIGFNSWIVKHLH